MWGRTDLLYGIKLDSSAAAAGAVDVSFAAEKDDKNKLCLSSYLWQTFNFFVSNVLETVFVKQEREQIEHGSETSQDAMVSSEG